MKKLIYVPVIHTGADLGSLARSVTKRGIARLGKDIWEEHKAAVDGFWDAISNYFNSIDVSGMRVYQDGMVTDGEAGQKIVEEGVKAGSKNYEIIDGLLKKGAILAQTEDFPLVKKERDRIVRIAQAKTVTKKLIAYLKYKLTKNRLLKRRDNYIVKKIDETLQHGETGILFIGAYHNMLPKLAGKIRITEVKEVGKVRDYQRLLLSVKKNKEEFDGLAKYLISPVS